MSKWTGTVCILLGATLIISALLLLRYNWEEAEYAGDAADAVIMDLKNILQMEDVILEENDSGEMASSGVQNRSDTDAQKQTNPDQQNQTAADAQNQTAADARNDSAINEAAMVAVQASNGYEYVGVLTISALGLELPVMSECDYKRLKLAPCRQHGSAESEDLIIAAHNYKRHFGKLSQLNVGDRILFTDMEGNEYEYAVHEVITLLPTDVEQVANSDWPLVLYTCTYGGQARVVVNCERVENNSQQ